MIKFVGHFENYILWFSHFLNLAAKNGVTDLAAKLTSLRLIMPSVIWFSTTISA